MHKFFFILLLINSIFVSARDITYQLKIKSQYDGKVENTMLYFLEKDNVIYGVSDTIGTMRLKEKGKYI